MTCSYTAYCSRSCPVHEVGLSKRSRSLVQKPSSHDHEVMGRLCQQANMVAIWRLDSWPDVCEGLHNHDMEAFWLYPLLSNSIWSYGRHWCWCTLVLLYIIHMELSACCNVFAVGTNSDPSEHIASRKSGFSRRSFIVVFFP